MKNQGIALIKMQRDMNNDKKFEYKDKSYYFKIQRSNCQINVHHNK